MRRLSMGLCLILVLILAACSQERHTEVIDIELLPLPPGDLVGEAAQQAIRDSYRQYDNLHTMTFFGDFDEIIAVHHWSVWQELAQREAQERQGCSMFRYGARDGRRILGRNFDNETTDLFVHLCLPNDGYASIGFVPLKDVGFRPETPFDPLNPQHLQLLFFGPVVTIEGLNERGVCVTLASLDRQQVRQDPDKPSRFLIHLMREILDHAGSVDEAVQIAAGYNIFDNGREIISHHIFIGDPETSVVLEWVNGDMQVVPADEGGSVQIVTNSMLAGTSEDQRRQQCGRYRVLRRELLAVDDRDGAADDAGQPPLWQQGMDALAQAAQEKVTYELEGQPWIVSTEWSAVFDLTEREVHICLDRDFDTVYRVRMPGGDR